MPVTGATLHSAEFKDPNGGARTWSVTIFDGSTTFTLPGLSPNPLATSSGMDTLTVSALVIPGINLGNVGFDDADPEADRPLDRSDHLHPLRPNQPARTAFARAPAWGSTVTDSRRSGLSASVRRASRSSSRRK